jgi:hypothetical protein
MTLKMERVVERCMDEEEWLRRFGRFEALHLPVSPQDRLVRVLRTVGGSLTLVMLPGEAKIAKRRSIRPKPVGYESRIG